MPKAQPTPPSPQSQYEGFTWLGSQWGRSGNSTPAVIGAVAMGFAALIVCAVAFRALTWDRPVVVIASFAVAALCGVGCWFYAMEARFAARANREQEPFIPSPED